MAHPSAFSQLQACSMHSIVTTFRGADIKVEVANFCAAMDTLIDQDDIYLVQRQLIYWYWVINQHLSSSIPLSYRWGHMFTFSPIT